MLPGYGFRFCSAWRCRGTPAPIVARANAAMIGRWAAPNSPNAWRSSATSQPTEPEWFRTFLAGQIRGELGDRAREVGIEPG